MTLQIESPALHCGAETELNKMSLWGSINDRNIITAVQAACARRDAQRDRAVRLLAGCWKFKVGRRKFTDGCAVRPFC
jgi:hypothetical protein